MFSRGNRKLLPTGMAERIHLLDPLTDLRWAGFLERHGRASVFHTSPWLKALQETYDYQPVAYTTSAPGEALRNALLFCRVESWITGRRLVSLPFSDHCEPLVADATEFRQLLSAPQKELREGKWKYLDLRPLTSTLSQSVDQHADAACHCIHRLNLRPALPDLYRRLHVDSIRRKIERGRRENLTLSCGNSEALLEDFYRLHVITRRRQALPPHPRKWFANVLRLLGSTAIVRVARKGTTAIAAVLSIEHRRSLTYKYGCSDARFHNLGGMPFVFWDLVRDAKDRGMEEIDLGRSDLDNPGLITFKDRWGTSREPLVYARFPRQRRAANPDGVLFRMAGFVFSRCPTSLLAAAGNLLYPHVG